VSYPNFTITTQLFTGILLELANHFGQKNSKCSSLNQLLEYCDEVVDYAQKYSDTLVIYGESFGSVIAFRYAQTRPEKVSHLITSAQVSNVDRSEELSREYILQHHSGWRVDGMMNEFKANRVIPYYMLKISLLKQLGGYFGQDYKPQSMFSLKKHWNTPYSLLDYTFTLNPFKLLNGIKDDVASVDLFKNSELTMPWATTIGTDDYMVPHSLSREFFGRVQAPTKQIHTLKHIGHEHFREQPGVIADILIKAVN
jgi:pimeloyl-ACP methyl ester carboxylesterase